MNIYLQIFLIVVLLIMIFYFIGWTTSSKKKKCTKQPEIIFINYNTNLYDFETQKNIEDTFFNLVLLREILDNGNKETQKLVIPPLIDSISEIVLKIQPLLETENEIVVNIKETTFKLKKDGMGNVCFGAPVYFMCLNPKKKELYPYINDMIVVYHLMQLRKKGSINRDENVETILKTILTNVLPCPKNDFQLDFSQKYNDLLLTKLFNSSLDSDILSSLMMIILFANESKLIDTFMMRNDGSFFVNDSVVKYLQKFYKKRLEGNVISYQQMKHILFNDCYAKYTVHGFSKLNNKPEDIKARTDLIDSMMKKSLCASDNAAVTPAPAAVVPPTAETPVQTPASETYELKSILKNIENPEKSKKTVTFA